MMELSVLLWGSFSLDGSQLSVRTDNQRVNDAIHFPLLLSHPYFCFRIRFCSILYIYSHDKNAERNKYAGNVLISWCSQGEKSYRAQMS